MLLTDSRCDSNCFEALCGQGNNYPSTLFFPLISSRNLTKYIFHCHCHPRAVFVRMVQIYIICLSSSEYFCNGGSAQWMGVSDWTVPGTSGIAGEPSLLSFLWIVRPSFQSVLAKIRYIDAVYRETVGVLCERNIQDRLWLTPCLYAVWELQCFGYHLLNWFLLLWAAKSVLKKWGLYWLGESCNFAVTNGRKPHHLLFSIVAKSMSDFMYAPRGSFFNGLARY